MKIRNRKFFMVAAWVSILSAAGLAVGQSGSSSRTPDEQRTLARAERFILEVFPSLNFDELPDFMPDKFIEHYPAMVGTRDAFVAMFTPIKERMPSGLPRNEPIFRIVDGDVTAMVLLRPPADGKQRLWPNVSRWGNGKQVEHWDGYSIYAPTSMPYVDARSADEKRNLALVLKLWSDAMVPLRAQALDRYVSAQYVEHDAGMPQGGLKALSEYVSAQRSEHPNGLPRSKLIHTLVDGNLVALLRVKDGPADRQNPSPSMQIMGVDVFRVAGGKVVEHWGDWRSAPST